MSDKEFNVLALIKGPERFVHIYDDVSLPQLIEHFHQLAKDPESTFTHFDAAVLCEKARAQVEEALNNKRDFSS